MLKLQPQQNSYSLRFRGAAMKVLPVFALGLIASPAFAANTLAVLACPQRPVAGQDCLSRTLPSGQTLDIGPNDYYDVLIDSVCINQKDNWWHKKVISLSATVNPGLGASPVKMPVYSERATGNQCRLGVNNFALYTSIPSNGNPVSLQVDIMRSNDQNGLKQLLDFATTQEGNASLTTYAAEAVPYLTMALTFANQIYTAFGQSTTPELPMTPTSFTPRGMTDNTRDLRDAYLVEYSGPDSVKDGDFYVDSGGELYWSNGPQKDQPVRGDGTVWVVLRIQKREHRTDYYNRQWYKNWTGLLNNVIQAGAGVGTVNASTFQKTTSDCIALLNNDSDLTSGDRNRYVQSFTDTATAIVAELNKPTPNYAAIKSAVQAAEQPVETIRSTAKGSVVVTAASTSKPTILALPNTTVAPKAAIVPSILVEQLKMSLKPQ